MFAKAICVAVLSYQAVQCMHQPSTSKTSKVDNIQQEGHIIQLYILHVTTISPIFITVWTILYEALLFKGYISPELKFWHVAATICAILGWQLRSWSFRALDHFFTYELMIRPGHRLIQTGPYTYLRHPSYTGMMLACIPWTAVMFYRGPYDVLFLPFTHVPINFVTPLLISAIYFAIFLSIRVVNEEKMLKAHFGPLWDDYAKTRYRLVPFLY